jgi:isoquinoline 1-oxidoreductase beta subunit
MQYDWYRPASLVHFRGGLDADGWPVALTSRVTCPYFGGPRTAVEGIADMAYAIPNLLVDSHDVNLGIPVSYWRSVGFSQNTFFTESFIDELAVAGGKDPLELRRRLLANNPRMLAALNLAADKAGWGQPLPKGHARGIGLSNNIDCGQVVNPSGVEQQIQSGIAFGLSAALKGAITIDKGRVQQANFNQYDVLRLDEMPVVEVHLVPSHAAPGGIGEASTPGIAAAVANAVSAATGKRVRKLPIVV